MIDDEILEKALSELGIEVEHLLGFLHCLLGSRVRGVSFLPEEFGSPQKEPGSHFPADHIGPLID
jgi:hypothetical protein